MKPVFIFLVLSFVQSNLNYSQTHKKSEPDTIIWTSGLLLSTDDFKSKRTLRGAAAATSSGISVRTKSKDGIITLHVEAVFYKSKSFMKDESPYILKHEQLHFDITELYARKLREKIMQKDFKKVKNIKSEIDRMFDKILEDWEREQSNYDRETQHGINRSKQKVWIEKVKDRLLELEPYSSTEIYIDD